MNTILYLTLSLAKAILWISFEILLLFADLYNAVRGWYSTFKNFFKLLGMCILFVWWKLTEFFKKRKKDH